MARPPRILLPKTPVFITARVIEGLPFICASYMDAILLSALALAQTLHPVTIVAYCFMSNHVHLILVVDNPEDVCDFMERFKTESAHAINRLLGRRQRPVWCKGYDSPIILTAESTLEKLAYLFTNPVAARLVNSIDEYPGLNNWRMFFDHESTIQVHRIRRTDVPALPRNLRGPKANDQIAQQILKNSTETLTLNLSPEAWLSCFNLQEQKAEYRTKLITLVYANEQEMRDTRARQNTRVLGRRALLHERFFRAFIPKKFGHRMWCISSDLDLKKRFLNWIKSLLTRGREGLKMWKAGYRDWAYPIEMFPPSFPRLANPVPPYF